jgi:serine/threonine protein kinase
MIADEVRTLRALEALKHPHIIPLLGVHAHGKYVILVMERADGSLADLQRAYLEQTGGNIPPDHALDLLEQAARALDFMASARIPGLASSRGLQHCDIKPSNLLLVGNRLKVGDFGLCSGSGLITHRGGWKGTPPYAAPELFNGAASATTDQFALAVSFCELVMGRRPFWPAATAANPPTGIPIDLTKLREREFPIIARALHPYPSSRFPTCLAFIEAMRKACTNPRGNASVRIYPRGLRGSLNKASSGRHRAVKLSTLKIDRKA